MTISYRIREGFDPDIHMPESYNTWSKAQTRSVNSRINFYEDDGGGIMSGFAQTIYEFGQSQDALTVNKKRRYNKSSHGQILKMTCSCCMKCYDKLTNEQKQEFTEEFYDFKDIDRQRDFHIRHVKNEKKQRSHTKSENLTHSHTCKYLINVIKVCKVMYCSTLDVSKQSFTATLKKKVLAPHVPKTEKEKTEKK